ncbi:MAG TPA: methyl-accepting chemotaxis protein [Acidimicrobiia bacterium]|nr:methyl-accepting chemotaxis protein [Acidimicrobiia bacterium]
MTLLETDDRRVAELEERLERYRRALAEVATVCRAAAGGDLELRVPAIGDEPELADVRRSLNHMLDLTDAFVREAGASLEYASEGRFFRRFLIRGMKGSFRLGAETINRATSAMARADARLAEAEQERLRLAGDFETAVLSVAESVAAAATEMESTARSLSGTAETTAGRAGEVADGSIQASEAVASVAAGVEEMASTVGEIEQQAKRSKEAMDTAVADAERAEGTVRGLEAASREIDSVVAVINHVASQTRLLALNATIEAARAGAAGKGFAVVANEVKELAVRTGEATGQIADQVERIHTATGQAVSVIDAITANMREMGRSVGAIAEAVAEQRMATTDISRNTHQAADASQTLSAHVGDITAGTRETSDAATQLTDAALEVSRLSNVLRTEIDRFLAALR